MKILTIPVELADSDFYIPQDIDILIGAEIYFDILLGNKFISDTRIPPLQNSVLRCVVSDRKEF